MAAAEGQQHPLKIYWIMWIALFVLSGFSYATDFLPDSLLRQALIVTFMMLKAGGIVWIFMHMGWERLALKVAILVLIAMMAWEGGYVENNRIDNYGESTMEVETPGHH